MRILKQVVGIIGVLFGLLGVGLALAQIVGAWATNPPITQGPNEVNGALLKGLLMAEQTLAQSTAQTEELSSRLATLPANHMRPSSVWLAEQSAAPVQTGALSLAQIEAHRQEIETQLNALSARVSVARVQVAQAKNRPSFAVNWGTLALTFVYLWYSIAPFLLLILSWRWVRQPRNRAESTI